MAQNRSSNNRSVFQEISQLLWDSCVHYRVNAEPYPQPDESIPCPLILVL
jgi:hypothetical protein